MGSWISGLKITDGLLTGDVFSQISTDMNLESWNIAPDTQVQNFKYVQGDGQKWQGIDIINILRGMSSGDTVLLAGSDVNPGDSSPYIQGQIRWECTYSGSHYLKLIYRGYTDDTTYVDNVISPSDIAIAPIDIARDISIWLFFTFSSYAGESMVMTGICGSAQSAGQPTVYSLQAWAVSYFYFVGNIINGTVDTDETSPEFGPAAKPKGGYNDKSSHKGTFDDTSDKITASSAPTLSPLSTELMHCYKVNQTILNKVAEAMYPDYILSQPTVEEALEAIFNQIHYNKMVDYLLDLMILPIDVAAPHTVRIKVGGKTLKTADDPWIEASLVQNPYVDFSCGELSVPEYWANFLDFAGTKFKLFLPYVGYVDLQPEYINGGSIKIDYRFNVLDGSFICFIHSTSGHSELEESLIGQYAGVAAVHIPLQSTDYAAKVSGLISAVGTVAAGITTGGVGAGIAASANAVIQKPGTTHANGYNASSSYLSHRTPYLIIERQASQFSEKYPEEVGLPLYMQKRLGDCVGLTVASDAHLDTIPANAEVKDMISRLLSEGVIL